MQNPPPLLQRQDNMTQLAQQDSELPLPVLNRSTKGVSVIVKESCPIEFIETTQVNNTKKECLKRIETDSEFVSEKSINGVIVKKEIISNDEDQINQEDENVYSQIDELMDATNLVDNTFNNQNAEKMNKFSRCRKSAPSKLNVNIDTSKLLPAIISLQNDLLVNNASTSMSTKEYLLKTQNLNKKSRHNSVESIIPQKLNTERSKSVEDTYKLDNLNAIPTLISGTTTHFLAKPNINSPINSTNFDDNTTLQTVIQSSFTKMNLSEV